MLMLIEIAASSDDHKLAAMASFQVIKAELGFKGMKATCTTGK